MSLKKLSSLIVLLFSILHTIIQTNSTPTYVYSVCSNTTTFANNTRYQTNLNTLFRSLSNATSNPTGFHITSVANNPSDAVYGLFLCRGDQNVTACSDCVKTATTTDLPKNYCPNRKVAVIWYDECLLRYSNEPLLGIMEQAPSVVLMNTQNITGNQSQFTDILGNNMDDLAAQASSSSSGKKYATKVAKFNSLNTLYALGQCTPDLSMSDCNWCLMIAIGKIYVRMGAQVLQPSCVLQYETYPFYAGGDNTSPPPSPSPLPGTNSTIGIGKGGSTTRGKKRLSHINLFVAIPTTIALLSLLLIFLSRSIYMRKRKTLEDNKAAEIDELITEESLQFSLSRIRAATRNFSIDNKLGQGGFGEVYKGIYDGGQEIAIKRLSKNSRQGVAEFKTEVLLVAKLQHKNLVKLLGFCVESKEKILIYEFLPNSSLDQILFGNIICSI